MPRRRFAIRSYGRSTGIVRKAAIAASDQGEVWDEVRKCLDGVQARSETSSLTDAFGAAEETLRAQCKRSVFPEGAAGVLVGRHDRIIGMDLFDSPTTLKTLWDRFRTPICSMPCVILRLFRRRPSTMRKKFIERLGNAAKPRIPALALGEELEITGEGLVGAALLYDGGLCHLAAFSGRIAVRKGWTYGSERITPQRLPGGLSEGKCGLCLYSVSLLAPKDEHDG